MLSTLTEITIAEMKAQARVARATMDRALDGADCGVALLRTVSPTYSEAERQYDAALAWLREYDPQFPKAKEP